MDRKDFFTKSCQCGIASLAGLLFLSNNSFSQTDSTSSLNESDELDKLKNQIDFSQHRFTDLINHLDKYLDKETRMQLYQKVGESCASTYVDTLVSFKGNLKGILDEQLKQDWLKEYDLNEEKGELRLVGKPKENCGCPLVKKGLTPVEYCNCSIGHMKKLYEVITEKNLNVQLESSILMGNEQCSFIIKYT